MALSDYGINVEPREGNQLTLCPRCSHDRKKATERCLSVNYDKGVWNCHHCGWKGKDIDPERQAENDAMYEWFAKRGISRATVMSAGITVDKGWIKFPYTKRWKEVNAKYRRIDKKEFRQDKGGEKTLYGMDHTLEDVKYLVWVEGEMDVLACREAGVTNVVSVPDGAPNPGSAEGTKLSFLDSPEWESILNKVPLHIIAVDEDAPGRALKDALISRLGVENVKVASWLEDDGTVLCKDANDFLLKHGKTKLFTRLDTAKEVPVTGVFYVKDLQEDMFRDYNEGVELGKDVGIPGLERLWTVRPKELSVIHGYPGCGKSTAMTRIAVNLAANHGWRFAMFAAETVLHRYANRIVSMYLEKPLRDWEGNKVPMREYAEGMAWAHKHFSFLLHPDDTNLDFILSRAQSQVRRWGANAIVIDPWTEMSIDVKQGENMTNAIERGLRRIQKFTKNNNVHFFILAHPSKPKEAFSGDKPPHPSSISNSMQWYNKPDCIVCIHRPEKYVNREVDIHVQKIRSDEIGDRGIARLEYNRYTGVYSGRIEGGGETARRSVAWKPTRNPRVEDREEA